MEKDSILFGLISNVGRMTEQKNRQQAEYYSDPNNSIGYLTRVAFRSFSRLLEQRTLQHGVSAGQWRFLRQLWLNDGITQRELSEKVGLREPTTVIAIRSLEKAGLVTRKKSKVDRRKIHIHLTKEAKRLEHVLGPCVAEVQDMATRSMSDRDIEQLQALLKTTIDNLAEESEKLPPAASRV
ncbi:MarR family winged helix-turn-helix transcriptional regulator [Parasphingopyxis lamellibrachiae]|uniref:MarR family winged helix-turn-helix transcriptional regulator n=1 Tax=Parasphingopyxis lamellibrachiae TaxID=680125 RepID=UPI001FE5F17D|nr:MarR family transcriptional regulator [Parasphingopyxis lamellibrachiae]